MTTSRFSHEVMVGAAARSYGVQVAKLAGLPAAVIERAKVVLAELEAEDRTSPARRLIDDLPLFSAAARAPAPPARSPPSTPTTSPRAKRSRRSTGSSCWRRSGRGEVSLTNLDRSRPIIMI